MKKTLIYDSPIETRSHSEPWVLCRGFEVIYSLGTGVNAEPIVSLLPEYQESRQLSNTRSKCFADEFDKVGQLLASLSTQADLDRNDALINEYFNPIKEWVYARAYLTTNHLCVSSDDRTWLLPRTAMKSIKPKYRQTLINGYAFSATFSIAVLDNLHDPNLGAKAK
jgi:hypothetical protein